MIFSFKRVDQRTQSIREMRIPLLLAASFIPLVMSHADSIGEYDADNMSPGLHLWSNIGKGMRLLLRGNTELPTLLYNVSFPESVGNVTEIPFYRVNSFSKILAAAYLCFTAPCNRNLHCRALSRRSNMLAIPHRT